MAPGLFSAALREISIHLGSTCVAFTVCITLLLGFYTATKIDSSALQFSSSIPSVMI